MRITTLIRKNNFLLYLLLCFLTGIQCVYSQCPTVTDATQSFCDTQTPTVASLQATDNGGGIKWYDTAISTTALSSSLSLQNGQDYFADDNTGTCGIRQSVVVTVYTAPTGANFQGVCVTSLSQAVQTNPQFNIIGNNLQWYTTPSGVTPIPLATILNDNTIYYISQTNPDTGCQTSRLSVFINVGLVPVPTGDAVQEFCSVAAPTVANLVASGNNNWYLTSTFGIPLDPSTPLVNGETYYATTVDPPCESSDRLAVLVNILQPNNAGTDGARAICVNNISSTAPFDLFNLLGGSPDATGVWTGPITTSNGSQGTLDVSTMTLAGSPYVFHYTVSSSVCVSDDAVVTITILPLPTVTISGNTTICSGNSTTVTFTGTPNATVTYTVNSGSNQTIVLNGSGTATINITYTATTTYALVSVASATTPSCTQPQVGSVTINVLPLPTASAAFSPAPICANTSSTLTFTGTPNATVTYTINGGSNQTIVLNGTGTAILVGTYVVNTTVILVSVASASNPICTQLLGTTIVLTVIDPTATAAFSPATICANTSSTLTFTGTPNATVTYTINGGSNQTIVLNGAGTATLVGTYTLTTTVVLVSVTTAGSPTCTKLLGTVITLTVIDPTASAVFNPTTICANTSSTLIFTGTPNATVTYTINGGSNQTIVLNGAGTATLVGTYTVNTTVVLVSVTTAGSPSCTKLLGTTIILTVIDPTATAAFNPTTICSNTNSTLTFTGTPNATVTYTINGGSNQTILLDGAGTATLSGTYTVNTTIVLVSVTTAGSPSCTKLLGTTIVLTVIDPTATATFNPTTICANTSSTLTFTGTPNATVTYTINGGSNQTIVLNGAGTATLVGTYTLTTTVVLVSVTTAGSPSCTKLLGTIIALTVIDPVATAAFNPTTICANTSSTLTFTGTPNATVTYTINGGSNQTIVLNGAGTATLVGTYTVNTTVVLVSVNTAGSPSCTKLLGTTIILTVIDPTATATFNPTTICSNTSSTLTFTGTPNATVTYTINGGSNQTILLDGGGTATLVGTYTVNTTVVLVSVTTAGSPSCTKVLGTIITLTVIDPIATAAFSPATICTNTSSTLTFTGTPNATVTYTINGGSNQTIVLNGTGTATIVGTYTLTTTVVLVSVTAAGSPSCTKLLGTIITLTVIDPTATTAFNPTTICSNTSSTLTFTGTPNATVTYTINGGSNQTIVLDGTGTATLVGTYTATTTVVLVSVTTAGSPSCTKLLGTIITLTVIDATATAAFNPTTICANTSSTLTFTGTPNATVTYTINGGSNQTIVLDGSGTATLVGTYTLTTTVVLVSITTAGSPNCTKLLGTIITLTVIDPTATASFAPNTICANTSATLTFTGTPNATVTYTIDGGSNQTIVLDGTGTATLVGTYTLTTTVVLVSVTTAGSPSCTKLLGTVITLTVVDPTATASFAPTTICANTSSTLTFTGTPNATVTYTINGGSNQTIILDGAGTTTLVGTYTVNTTVVLVSVATAGSPNCTKLLGTIITLTVIDPTATATFSPATICVNTSSILTFTGTPNATVTYTIDGGSDQTIVLDGTGTATLTGTYTLTTTVVLVSVTTSGSPSCTKLLGTIITLTVVDPTATASFAPTTICANTSSTLTFTGTPNATVTYTINGGSNQTIVLNGAGIAAITTTNLITTTVTLVSVATTSPSCNKLLGTIITLTVIDATATAAFTPTTICANTSSTLTFTGTPNATVNYTINGGSNQTIVLDGAGTAALVGTYTVNTTVVLVSVTTAGSPSCTKLLGTIITLTVIDPTATAAFTPATICANTSSTLTFTGTPNATVTYTIDGGSDQTIVLNGAGTATLVSTYTLTTTIVLVSVTTAGSPSCTKLLGTIITLTVIQLPTVTIASSTTICSGDSATVTFTGTPNAAITYTINGGSNQTIVLDALGSATITNTYLADATFTLVSATTSGAPSCSNSQSGSVLITVLPLPVVTIASNFSSVCENGQATVTFTGTPNATVTYTINGGSNQTIVLDATGIATIISNYSVTTTYTLISITSSGAQPCTKPLTDTITITVIPFPTVTIAANTTLVCSGDSVTVTFTGSPNATVTYTINGGSNQTIVLNGAGTATIVSTYALTTTYALVSITTATVPSCSQLQNGSVVITVSQPAVAGVSTTHSFCSNGPALDLFTLLGNTAQLGGTWMPAMASGTGLFNPAVDTAVVYTYTVTGTAPCPDSLSTVDVSVSPVPDAGTGATVPICSNANPIDLFTSLTGTPQTGGTWSPSLASGTGVFNPAVDVAGNYDYTITGIAPCADAIATITVNVTVGPEAGQNGTVTLCLNSTPEDLFTHLGATAQVGGTWSPALASGTGVFNPGVDTAATYTYAFSGPQTCDNDSATVTVTVNPIPDAGTGNPKEFCSNDAPQDLFASLTGTPQTGGTWSPALASGTGVFNPAVDPAITYTYTVGGGLCTTSTATVIVTVTQAPNAGGVGQTLTVCANVTSVDLFTGLDGTQGVGTWADDDSTGALSNNIFNPTTAGAGTYHFTYTVTGGTSPCISNTAIVTVVVNPLPNAGTFTGIQSICPSVGVFDVTTLLTGQQAGGVWTDNANGNAVITTPITIITFAPNTYSYTYTVTNSCGSDPEVVQFTVLPNPQLTSVNITTTPICLGSSETVNLSGIVDGTYTINYDLNGSNTLANQSVVVTIASNVGSFIIPAASIPNVGTTVINFTSIQNTTSTCAVTLVGVAKSFVINPLADLVDANLSATNVCLGNAITVNIAGATGLPDGVYVFNYTIPTGTPTTGNSGNVTITSGVGQFAIPGSTFATAGIYSLTVNGIVTTTGCSNLTENSTVNFELLALPNVTGATLSVQSTCVSFSTGVTISNAGNLADGTYAITYQLTGANSATTTINVTFVAGVGSFTIPSTDLANAGDTTMTINQIDSIITPCGVTGTSFTPFTFTVTSLGTPILSPNGNLFCEANSPTVANLSSNINGTETVIWYNANSGGTAYNPTDLLVNGTTYFASFVAGSGCESPTRLPVTVDLTVCNDLLIPDGFSPNNDGINDEFVIENLPLLYPYFRLQIFNRYGSLVYVGRINSQNWNGTSSEGHLNLGNGVLPTGVYFYVLEFNDGTRKPVQGRLYLNR